MKNGNRKFKEGAVMHVYQRAIHGFNIFYTLYDYLVFYTIFAVFLQRFNISALSMCLMIDHFHALLVCESKVSLSKFIASVTSLYARQFNRTIGRKGQLFDKSFGSAPKIYDKQVRTVVPYVFNNPVEKIICSNPIDYRWNFMAYLSSDYPFSEKSDVSKSSRSYRKAISEIAYCHLNGLWLNHKQLGRLYRSLSLSEQARLTDYIIQTYYPFDKEKLLSYYKSFEHMNLAIRSTTGCEYDINEEYHRFSDKLYSDIEHYIIDCLFLKPKSILVLPMEEKIQIADKLAKNTMASNRQIAKYLHIPLKSCGA